MKLFNSKSFILALFTVVISGTVVVQPDGQTVKAHDILPDGTKVDESIHYDPHRVSHTIREIRRGSKGHHEVVIKKSFSAYGKDSSSAVKKVVGKLHPRIRALQAEYERYKNKYLH